MRRLIEFGTVISFTLAGGFGLFAVWPKDAETWDTTRGALAAASLISLVIGLVGLALIFSTSFRALFRGWREHIGAVLLFAGSRLHPRPMVIHFNETAAHTPSPDRRLFQGESLYLFDLVRGSVPPVLEGRTFLNCHIWGPAVLAPTGVGDVNLLDCTFDAHPDQAFLRVESPRVLVGVVGVSNLVFRECSFHNVGFVGDDAAIEDARRAAERRAPRPATARPRRRKLSPGKHDASS
jgi:hypothetical protein